MSERIVLVTGASGGIGAAVAQRFAACGDRVIRSDIKVTQGSETLLHDVASESSWKDVLAYIHEQYGRLDVLVNAAGIVLPMDIEDTSYEQWLKIMTVNAGSVFLGCKHALAQMKLQSSPSAIVNIGSTTAERTAAWVTAYGASKAAVSSLTRSVALHCAKKRYPIRCNAVLPGVVHTSLVDSVLAASSDPDASLAGLVATNPAGRLVTPDEVANAVFYLASEQASSINGTCLPIDGAQLAGER